METIEAAALARGRAGRQAEELVRMEVMANALRELPPPSLRQKLAASHCALCSTVSPQALAARLWR